MEMNSHLVFSWYNETLSTIIVKLVTKKFLANNWQNTPLVIAYHWQKVRPIGVGETFRVFLKIVSCVIGGNSQLCLSQKSGILYTIPSMLSAYYVPIKTSSTSIRCQKWNQPSQSFLWWNGSWLSKSFTYYCLKKFLDEFFLCRNYFFWFRAMGGVPFLDYSLRPIEEPISVLLKKYTFQFWTIYRDRSPIP